LTEEAVRRLRRFTQINRQSFEDGEKLADSCFPFGWVMGEVGLLEGLGILVPVTGIFSLPPPRPYNSVVAGGDWWESLAGGAPALQLEWSPGATGEEGNIDRDGGVPSGIGRAIVGERSAVIPIDRDSGGVAMGNGGGSKVETEA
jgi:hypothetical protein